VRSYSKKAVEQRSVGEGEVIRGTFHRFVSRARNGLRGPQADFWIG